MESFRDLVRYVSIYTKYLGYRLYVILGLTVVVAFAQGFGITLLLPLLRSTQSGQTADDANMAEAALQDVMAWMGIADSITGILLFIGAVFLGKGCLHFAKEGYKGHLQAQLLRELKTKLFDAYSGMDYREYVKENAGHFINVITEQTKRFFQSFKYFINFCTHVVTTISYFAFAFAITWKFASMAFVLGGFILFGFRYVNIYVRDLSRKRSEEMSHLNKLLVQSLQSFKYVVSTNQMGQLREGVMSSVRRLTDYIFKQMVLRAVTAALKEPVSVLLVVGVIALQVNVFQEPIAPIFVALLLFHRGMQEVVAVQSGWQNTMNGIGSVEMVDDELKRVSGVQEKSGSTVVETLEEGIAFDAIYYRYEEEDDFAIRGVDLTVDANTTVAVVGESGAGKSTIVDLMTLLLRPERGDIWIDGVHHDDVDTVSWRSQIGYVSQEAVVFDDSILNNITLWQDEVSGDRIQMEKVRYAARRAHADQFIRDLPRGYYTVVGERGVRLSGGQRQRLFIARELFKQPNLLLLDEATSALDTESERHIQRSIDNLKGEITVVIVAHRLSTIKNADNVYVLERGRVIEQGSFETLRSNSASRFREMVDLQRL